MLILKAFVLVIAAGATLLGVELSEHVHSERWKVKTLSDAYVLNQNAIPTTIEEQAAIPQPEVGESVRRLPSEKTLYELTAQVVEVKKEFDGDYHLVLEDPKTHQRMVAEIPDTTAKAPEQYRKDYIAARSEVERLIGKTPGMFAVHPLNALTVKIQGVGFFDEPHMFTPEGMAQNCREIHPVLRVTPIQESLSKN